MSVNAVYSVLAQAALVVGGVLLAALVPGALALGCLIVWWFVLIEMPAALRERRVQDRRWRRVQREMGDGR